MQNIYKVLAEKYTSLYPEERVVEQIPLTDGENKILVKVYDFKKDKDTEFGLRRIYAAGEIETIIKYSDGTFVLMREDARGTTKHEFPNFFALTRKLRVIYKANADIEGQQNPVGADMPKGLEPGGQI